MMVRGIDKGQKPALLISEMQRAMADRTILDRVLSQQVEERGIIGNIARLADAFRAAGAPVVHCTLVPESDYRGFPVNCILTANLRKRNLLRRGQPGAEIVDGLTPKPGDVVSERLAGITGFHATELERTLRGYGVSTVVLAGVSTNIALPGMATEAVNRGFEVVIPEDCVAGGDVEGHEMSLSRHLLLLGAISTSGEVADAVGRQGWLGRAAS
jgi:nicotinamidase-related amidase